MCKYCLSFVFPLCSWLCRARPWGRVSSLSGSSTLTNVSLISTQWNIPSKGTCELLAANPSLFRSLDHKLFKHCITTLWSTYGNVLALPRKDDPILDWHEKEEQAPPLIAICDALFRNEEKPMGADPDDGVEWMDSFMGPNLRFEMLGILFCFLGTGYLALPDVRTSSSSSQSILSLDSKDVSLHSFTPLIFVYLRFAGKTANSHAVGSCIQTSRELWARQEASRLEDERVC